ncbi:MAG: ABC transporter ATP-binding protein [Paracoccaceae bacterium]|jgi:NitT/TauT family transport system ATP-binding protein|nr:ABC transporter ATP-binding protein [Paracoccaceae bacterium]
MNVRLTAPGEVPAMPAARTVATSNAAVEFGRVTKSFGDVTAIENVSLRVPAGEFTVLIGPSGCGKSTLLSLAAGLEAPSEGFVTAHGREVTGPSRDTALIFQQHNLFPWMTTEANVAYGLRSRGMARREALARARELLARVGLSDFAKKPPTALSGGMRQRVALVRAFATEPTLLLMDEPFGALDHQTRKIMQAYLLSTWRDSGATVVMVTHDLDEALMLADRLVLFTGQPGRIAETLDIAAPRPRSRDDPGLREIGARLERHLAAAAEAAEFTEAERARLASC